MGWLRDGMEDEGGILFDIEEREHEEYENNLVKLDRQKRMRKLEGKYVVCTNGYSSGHLVFYQNPQVSRNGYWTRFLSNAKPFEALEEARKLKNAFKYGNPRIAQVVNSNYKWVQ